MIQVVELWEKGKAFHFPSKRNLGQFTIQSQELKSVTSNIQSTSAGDESTMMIQSHQGSVDASGSFSLTISKNQMQAN